MNDKHNPSRKFSLTEILTAEYPLSIDCLNAIEKLVSPWERQAGDNISVKGKINDKWIFISTGLCRVYTTKKDKEDTIFFWRSRRHLHFFPLYFPAEKICSGPSSSFRLQWMVFKSL